MAVLLMFCASACFVTMSAVVKAMGESLPLIELMFLRSVIAVPFLLVLLSVVYGYFFWNEIPTLTSWIGGALVVSGGMYLMISSWRGSEPARS